MKTIEKTLWALGALAFLVGAFGLVQRLLNGHIQMAYGSYIPWGLWVAVYVYLVWLEVGSVLAYAALVHVFGLKRLEPVGKFVLLVALAVLVGALAQIGLDLGHTGRFWRAIFAPSLRSPMAWMIWLHLIYMALLVAELVFVLRGARDEASRRTARRLAIIGLPVGMALITVVGSIFGVVAAQPLWNSVALPLAFLVSSLVAGGALLALIYVLAAPQGNRVEYRESVRVLGRLLLGLTLFGLFIAVVNGTVALYSNIPAQANALRLALTGPYWWSYWIVHLALGIVVPVIILIWQPRSPRWVATAAAIIVVTFVAVPLNIIVPSLAVPDFEALRQAYSGPGLSFDYFPSVTEWLVSLWVISVVWLGILAGNRFILNRPAPKPVVKPQPAPARG